MALRIEIDAGKADNVSGERTLRVIAAMFGLRANATQPQRHGAVALLFS